MKMITLLTALALLTTMFAGCTSNPADQADYTDKPPLIGTSPTDYFSITIPLSYTLDAEGTNTRDGTTWTHRSSYKIQIEVQDTDKSTYGDVAPDADQNTLSMTTTEVQTSEPQNCNGDTFAGEADNLVYSINPVFRENGALDAGDSRPFGKITMFVDRFKSNLIYTFIPITCTIHLTINDGPELASWDIVLPIPVHMPPPGKTVHDEQNINLRLFTPFKTLTAHMTDVTVKGATRTGWAWVKTENQDITDDWGALGRFIQWLPTKGRLIELVYEAYKWIDVPEGGSDHRFSDPILSSAETYFYKIRG